LEDLLELASNMRGMAVEDWRVSILNLSWMFHNDDLSIESFTSLSWILLGIRCDCSSGDILDSKTFDVESDVVTRISSLELSVVLLNRFNFSFNSRWGELGNYSWLKDTSLNSSNWNSSNS
jgi:hypothetical protein